MQGQAGRLILTNGVFRQSNGVFWRSNGVFGRSQQSLNIDELLQRRFGGQKAFFLAATAKNSAISISGRNSAPPGFPGMCIYIYICIYIYNPVSQSVGNTRVSLWVPAQNAFYRKNKKHMLDARPSRQVVSHLDCIPQTINKATST